MEHSETSSKNLLKEATRIKYDDCFFHSDVENSKLKKHLFTRVTAKTIRFKNVDFSYSIFDTCYFRKCVFDSCDFTGCRFVNTNFNSCSHPGSKFDYAQFDKTDIETAILDENCPNHVNLKQDFARSLRKNYSSLGMSKAVNKAILIELDATAEHLKNKVYSKSTYYREKYSGFFTRTICVIDYYWFKLQEFIWGNGESMPKLLKSVIILLLFLAVVHVSIYSQNDFLSLFKAIGYSPQVFMGVERPVLYPSSYLTFLYVLRLVLFGMFMSILIKRFNRR